MSRMIFVNLPVTDLARSIAFYTAMGMQQDMRFSDETAAGMQWSDTIVTMLLTHEKWRSFTDRPIPDSGSSEVALCISCESREEVDRLTVSAADHGGTAEVNPAQDHGFMYGRSFTDPDGHVWEPMWMDMAAFEAAQTSAA